MAREGTSRSNMEDLIVCNIKQTTNCRYMSLQTGPSMYGYAQYAHADSSKDSQKHDINVTAQSICMHVQACTRVHIQIGMCMHLHAHMHAHIDIFIEWLCYPWR
mmetsp:Transcript_50484/g.83658  ORF Transcript_50484/g.83658 Transcript_50484/m.83658 type:complete len:104 (+) Transcript_50484:222-533(+)